MRPATKHYLFFAFLIVSLALLVAFVLWQWHRARAEGAERVLDPGGRLGHPKRAVAVCRCPVTPLPRYLPPDFRLPLHRPPGAHKVMGVMWSSRTVSSE